MSDVDLADRLRAGLAPTNLRRYRTAIEAVFAVMYLLLFLGPAAMNSGVGVIGVLLLASTLLLYRWLPLLALGLGVLGEVVLLLAGFYWNVFNLAVLLPLLAVFFGAAAYGRSVTRGLALPTTTIAALASLVVALSPTSSIYPGYWGIGEAFVLYLFVVALFAIAWIAGYLTVTLRARERAETGQLVATARLGEVWQEVTLEQERNRVARDVHDIVAHSLAVVIAQADGARYAAKDMSPVVAETLENIAATARGALTDVRLLLGELRHNQEAGPQPGMDDLDSLVRSFRESGLEVEWSSYGEATPLGEAAGLAAYRIVQESLTNALRHGDRAAPVDLEFDWGPSTLTITVTNDVPPGAPAGGNPSGHGLPGMRERVGLAGGDFHAGGGTNGRFRVRVTLPADGTATGVSPIVPAEA